jgi:hypothetical protein
MGIFVAVIPSTFVYLLPIVIGRVLWNHEDAHQVTSYYETLFAATI